MSDRDFWLVYIAVIVLLPMVPAIAIFKLLPSRAAVAGPLRGLKINLGGAFAAYFVVLLVLLGMYPKPPESEHTQVWQVTGKVRFSDQEDLPFFEAVRFSLVPPPERVENDGSFSIKVLATTSNGGKRVELGGLLVGAEDYQPVYKNLDKHPRDMKNQTVDIGQTIELRPKPPPVSKAVKPMEPNGGNQ